jgi:hypothetical protein
VVVAGLCVFTASQGPELIGFANGSPVAQAQSMAAGSLVPSSVGVRTIKQSSGNLEPKMIPASLKTPELGSRVRAWNTSYRMSSAAQQKSRERRHATYTLTNLHAANKIEREPMVLAGLDTPEYVTVHKELMIVVAQPGSASPLRWQVQVVEIRMMQAKPHKQNPQKI